MKEIQKQIAELIKLQEKQKDLVPILIQIGFQLQELNKKVSFFYNDFLAIMRKNE